MKNILAFTFCLALCAGLHGQTMTWVPLLPGTSLDKCSCAATKKENLRCYALQYTPAVSGTLTSYTTGFLVPCTSLGGVIQKNASCSMINNVNLIDGCKEIGQYLFNSSGNSGNPTNNKVTAGQPVYLHQVCFSVPAGETITVTEEELTDLTTSIDLGNGQVATETPAYIPIKVGTPKPDVAKPTAWLDFKATPANNLVSQLDWSIRNAGTHKISIEHSLDGINFVSVGELNAKEGAEIASYEFLHHNANLGFNFYRLQLINNQGTFEYSPIRLVSFSDGNMSMKAWPSPVDEELNVFVSQAKSAGHFEIMDAEGKKVSEKVFEAGDSSHKMNVSQMVPGLYTVVLVSGTTRLNEKIIVIH